MTSPSQGEARQRPSVREDEPGGRPGEEPQPAVQVGALALVGSGEFTPAMRATDEALLDAVEDAGFERAVAVIPTAAATEGDQVVARWFRMAREHYAALDAEVLELDVRDRHEATELRHVADVGEVGLVYLSGGKPDHLAAVLRGTPLLDAVLERWRLGAALAGCSAGAMAIAAGWPPFPRLWGQWGTGLGLLPGVAVVPHFDRVRRMTLGAVNRVGRHAPDGLRILGIDEDTALVHDGRGWHTEGAAATWELDAEGVRRVEHHTLPTPE